MTIKGLCRKICLFFEVILEPGEQSIDTVSRKYKPSKIKCGSNILPSNPSNHADGVSTLEQTIETSPKCSHENRGTTTLRGLGNMTEWRTGFLSQFSHQNSSRMREKLAALQIPHFIKRSPFSHLYMLPKKMPPRIKVLGINHVQIRR